MKAMVIRALCDLEKNKKPLVPLDIPIPEPDEGEILIKVAACGVCHTELDEIEGRTPPPRLPMIPGHQVVGRVEKSGGGTTGFKVGDRVGVAWIYSACGSCVFCLEGRENLCPRFMGTGRDAHGGYAEYMKVPEAFAVAVPDEFSDVEAAPLLCAGAVGYRSLRLTGMKDGENIGLTGFGASGHLVLEMVKHLYPGSGIYVFARSEGERNFAREQGAVWAGDTADVPPERPDCIIDTTPAWKPVVEALRNLKRGGRLVINAIGKEDGDKGYLQRISYQDHLWMEKSLKTVANVTRKDVSEFLSIAADIPVRPVISTYPLASANEALVELKERKIRGAKVLVMDGSQAEGP